MERAIGSYVSCVNVLKVVEEERKKKKEIRTPDDEGKPRIDPAALRDLSVVVVVVNKQHVGTILFFFLSFSCCLILFFWGDSRSLRPIKWEELIKSYVIRIKKHAYITHCWLAHTHSPDAMFDKKA